MEASTNVVVGNNSYGGGIGENSDDECCLCGKLWIPSCTGWPLCDTPDCPNVCCASCSEALIVSDLFYCPICAGSGTNAAATVGGSIATSIKVCSELVDKLPLSQKAIKSILRNLIKKPNEPKYRKLRLNNPKVKELLDLDPCRRLLTTIGFMQQQDEQNETVLVLEGKTDIEEMKQLLDVLEGLSQECESQVDETKESDDSPSDNKDSTTQKSDVATPNNTSSDSQPPKRGAPPSIPHAGTGKVILKKKKKNEGETSDEPSSDTGTKRQKFDYGIKEDDE